MHQKIICDNLLIKFRVDGEHNNLEMLQLVKQII